jgi:DNA-3-methyladenine glycosylase
VRRDRDLANGPGKLCAALGIDGSLSGLPLDRPPLRLVRGDPVVDSAVRVSPRIGISRAADWPLRYFVAGSECVSRTPKGFFQRPYDEAPRHELRGTRDE